MNIGQRVREAREALGMQRTVLARRVGVAENTIYRIETAKRTPSVELLEKIARVLRTEPAEFLREPSPNDVLKDERPRWKEAVQRSRQLRETGRGRLEKAIAAWHGSEDRQALEDICDLLDEALQMETELWLVGLSGPFGDDEQREARAAGDFYVELLTRISVSGFGVEGGQADRIDSPRDEQLRPYRSARTEQSRLHRIRPAPAGRTLPGPAEAKHRSPRGRHE
jgi:transcriptional regulator with XRE-family HTH domain